MLPTPGRRFTLVGNTTLTAAMVGRAETWYLSSIVGANHGVVEYNLHRLFVPLGLRTTDLETTWVAGMNSFGLLRGASAHTSRRTQSPPDPQTEWQRVKGLVSYASELYWRLGAWR